MSLKWSPNWLLVFTVILFMTAFTMFVVSQRSQLGLKKCAYGGQTYSSGQVIPGERGCFCDKNGKVVCTPPVVSKSEFDTSEYTSDNLSFSYKLLNAVTTSEVTRSVIFSDITTKEDGIDITVERLSMCGDEGQLPPQMGYYMLDNQDLYLTVSTNLLAGDYAGECFVSSTYSIKDLDELTDSFRIYFQDENQQIFNAEICILEGKVYNKGDAFVGEEGNVVVCSFD